MNMNQKGFAPIAIILIIVGVLIILGYVWILLSGSPAGGKKEVNLGEEFTLKINEVAHVRNTEPPVSLKINVFLLPPIGLSKAVSYRLTVGDKVYKGDSNNPISLEAEAPYIIVVKKSDFDTYAKFVIDKSNITAKPTYDMCSASIPGEPEVKATVISLCQDSKGNQFYVVSYATKSGTAYFDLDKKFIARCDVSLGEPLSEKCQALEKHSCDWKKDLKQDFCGP